MKCENEVQAPFCQLNLHTLVSHYVVDYAFRTYLPVYLLPSV